MVPYHLKEACADCNTDYTVLKPEISVETNIILYQATSFVSMAAVALLSIQKLGLGYVYSGDLS